MLLLTHEDVAGLLSPKDAIEAVRAGLKEQAAGQVQIPPRTTTDYTSGKGWLRLMPVIMNGAGYMGFKAMHSTAGVGVRYRISLYEMDSGELLSEMDADWITSHRTSAMVAVATDELARKEATELGVLGSSEQAKAMVQAVAAVRSFRRVRVFSPNPEHRRAFVESIRSQLEIDAVAVDSAEEAAAAEVVCVAIRAGEEPAFRAGWLRSGAHFSGISSVRPEAREIEDAVWSRADVVVVDDLGHVLESGDGRSGLASGELREERMAELWQIVSGEKPGRTTPDQITLFKSVGTALQDLSLAIAVYQRARERGIGRDAGEFPHIRPFGRQ
ncbi:MAG TPA: ornithine cyclodeaminase family protein [Chloroflexota bacterium]|nr:ornithine cyclodeaminase family protein [Chloroflexota bacterium]